MSLDDRGITILNIIFDNPTITGSQIEKELNLSRKQLSYSLDKINYYLIENGYEEIVRLKTGRFVVSNETIQSFKSQKQEINKNDYVFSEQERLNLISLLLLAHDETLMINDFTYMLKISKNTVLSDLKKIQSNFLDSYNLKVMYERQSGYFIVGKEYEKRNFMIKIINSFLSTLNGENILNRILNINNDLMKDLEKNVEEVEGSLNVRFSDERMKEIPYILYFILRRINVNKTLDYLPEEYQHIVGTSEYNKVLKIFEKYSISEVFERMYIVSQFQMSSVNYIESNKEFEKDLEIVADLVLTKLENLICIKFDDRNALLDALMQHIKPAIYRIKYNYHIESNILNIIIPMHSSLFELTKHALKPLEDMIDKTFTDEEIAYITILFGGWLAKAGSLDIIEHKKKAIVVCTNGVSISHFLFIKLKEAFPEFTFLSSLSFREFNEFELDYDLIFSTVNLHTNKPQFLVKPIIDNYDIQVLRGRVFNKFIDKNIDSIDSSKLIPIIEKYTDIKDLKGLITSLKTYFGEIVYIPKEHEKKQKSLVELLPIENIIVTEKELEWKEAFDLASSVLLEDRSISESYVESMKSEIIIENPVWLIASGLILAHSGIDKGVNKLGMSLLKLPNEISINNYMNAQIIIVIATPNRKVHLRALNELIEIVENIDYLDGIKKAKNNKEIFEIISKERK